MKPSAALRFTETHGIVLVSAKGPVPNVAEFVAGEGIRGSWWGHAKGREIFRALGVVTESSDVLVCRLVGGKLTLVHRRLWPAIVALAHRLPRARLARVSQEHTAAGHHVNRTTPFPAWVPLEVARQAKTIAEDAAWAVLGEQLRNAIQPPKLPTRPARRRRET